MDEPRTPEFYRKKADHARQLAERVKGNIKNELLAVAAQYEELAQMAELLRTSAPTRDRDQIT